MRYVKPLPDRKVDPRGQKVRYTLTISGQKFDQTDISPESLEKLLDVGLLKQEPYPDPTPSEPWYARTRWLAGEPYNDWSPRIDIPSQFLGQWSQRLGDRHRKTKHVSLMERVQSRVFPNRAAPSSRPVNCRSQKHAEFLIKEGNF